MQYKSQFADDPEFLSKLMSVSQQSKSNQENYSDTDESELDLNCSDVINQSDTEQTEQKDNTASTSSKDKSTHDCITQQMINAQILAQLTNISQRLEKIEKPKCKKTADPTKIKNKKCKASHSIAQTVPTTSDSVIAPTSAVHKAPNPIGIDSNCMQATNSHSQDIPQLEVLRQNTIVQAQVEKRLRELSEADKSGIKQKSLKGGPVEVIVPHRVKWPHEYVLSGSSKERVSYDHLSITQWMAGFCRIMRDEKNPDNQRGMLDYLISLLDDANDFSWDAAKASHAVLICRMEQGEIKDYTQTDKIDRIRRANAQRHLPYTNNFQQHSAAKKSNVKATKSMPCQFFNQGSCVHQKLMRRVVLCTNIYVAHVLLQGGNNFLIRK